MVLTGSNKSRSYNGDYMEAGKHGEEIVLAYLMENPKIIKVDDVRDLRVLREADVDAVITTRDGTVTLAEIKSDRHLGVSGNVLFEVLRINHTCLAERCCVLGWSARSPAVWLLYYAPSVNKLYQCRFEDFRKVFQSYTKTSRKRTVISYVETDNIKSTVNILIPWQECVEIFTIRNI